MSISLVGDQLMTSPGSYRSSSDACISSSSGILSPPSSTMFTKVFTLIQCKRAEHVFSQPLLFSATLSSLESLYPSQSIAKLAFLIKA